jgi:23S rRNA G2069 N7-methylase RlmK/C1962 C5-methylase RlmI
VQEYEAPDTISPDKARQRLQHALGVIPLVLEIPREQMFFKVRKRQKGGAQYEKLDQTGEFHEVREGPCRLLVNFTDYLDTGLFLDHRDTRTMLGSWRGKTLSQSVRLHRHRHGARGARRGRFHHDGGHVIHLSRLGAAEFRAE